MCISSNEVHGFFLQKITGAGLLITTKFAGQAACHNLHQDITKKHIKQQVWLFDNGQIPFRMGNNWTDPLYCQEKEDFLAIVR